jgi:phosphinothricin acetyltransferase
MAKQSFSFRGVIESLRVGKPSPNLESQAPVIIRSASVEDCDAICEVYNFYINTSVITFDEQTMEVGAWKEKVIAAQELNLPFIVATTESLEILGFAYLAPWRYKSAYRKTVENTIYLKQGATGQGVGPKLLTELLRLGKEAGIKEVVAVISDSEADTSIKMHKNFGFKRVGHLPRVGFKFNRWLGVILMQKSL